MDRYLNHFIELYKNLTLELESEFNKIYSGHESNNNEISLAEIQSELNIIANSLHDNTFKEPKITLSGVGYSFCGFDITECDEDIDGSLKIDCLSFFAQKILKNGISYYSFELIEVYLKKIELNTKIETTLHFDLAMIHLVISPPVQGSYIVFMFAFGYQNKDKNKYEKIYDENDSDSYVLIESYEENIRLIKSLYLLCHEIPERIFEFLLEEKLFSVEERDEFLIFYDINIDLKNQEKYTIGIYE